MHYFFFHTYIINMGQDEHSISHCDEGCDDKKHRKAKPKKIPQRGLGVAQLEKLLSEQQQTKDAANIERTIWPEYYRPSLAQFENSIFLPIRSHPVSNGRVHGTKIPNEKALMSITRLNTAEEDINVNVSSGTSSSSGLSCHVEPPSNQSSYGSKFLQLRSNEDKIAGTKRPSPFPSHQYMCIKEPRNTYISHHRQSSLNSSRAYARDVIDLSEDKERLNGDFLTLAPPVNSSYYGTNSNSKHKLHLDRSSPEKHGTNGLMDQFYGFVQNQFTTRMSSGCIDNNEETIDLELKL